VEPQLDDSCATLATGGKIPAGYFCDIEINNTASKDLNVKRFVYETEMTLIGTISNLAFSPAE